MKPFGKKLACLLSPVKRLHDDLGRLLEEKKNKEEEIAGLERKITSLEQDNSVLADDCSRLDQRLRRIDTRYLTRVTRSLMPEPAAGEVARNYYVETVSHCDLRCGLCAHGHAKLFQRCPGRMSLQLFEEILDKIKEESPLATVAPYHYSEPMLHPQLPEMLSAIKNRGLSAAASFNWNMLRRLDDLLLSGIDHISVSISGFSQSVYERSHVRGHVDKVKKNLLKLRQALDHHGLSPVVSVIYHMYKDNLGEEFDQAKKFTEDLGFNFRPGWARCISIELALLYLRQMGLNRYVPPYNQKSWLADFPPLPASFMAMMDRIVYLPQDYLQGEWEKFTPLNCNRDRTQVHIRWSGQTSICGCVFDDRLSMGDFLTTPPEVYAATRAAHPLCLECRANNVIFYLQYIDMDSINEAAWARLKGVARPEHRF